MLAITLLTSYIAFSQTSSGIVHFLNPSSVSKPTGYSHSAVIDLGNCKMVTISGQVALDSSGKLRGQGDLAKETEQVFVNIKSILQAAGGSMDHIVKTGIFVVDLTQLQAFREVRNRFINSRNPPASTLVQVSRLFREDLLIEIEATAVIPK